jgi:O-6-methylguanine DNA methyltransferase
VSSNSKFYQDIIKTVKSIPSGQVLTYSQVANLSGHSKAYRTVGNILKNNFDPDIPCHRVLPSSYRLGSYNRGRWNKLLKLSHEGYYSKLIPRYYLCNNIRSIKREIKNNAIGVAVTTHNFYLILNSNKKAMAELTSLGKKINKIYSKTYWEYYCTSSDDQSLIANNQLLQGKNYIPLKDNTLYLELEKLKGDIGKKWLYELMQSYDSLVLVRIKNFGQGKDISIKEVFDFFEDNVDYYIDITE